MSQWYSRDNLDPRTMPLLPVVRLAWCVCVITLKLKLRETWLTSVALKKFNVAKKNFANCKEIASKEYKRSGRGTRRPMSVANVSSSSARKRLSVFKGVAAGQSLTLKALLLMKLLKDVSKS